VPTFRREPFVVVAPDGTRSAVNADRDLIVVCGRTPLFAHDYLHDAVGGVGPEAWPLLKHALAKATKRTALRHRLPKPPTFARMG